MAPETADLALHQQLRKRFLRLKGLFDIAESGALPDRPGLAAPGAQGPSLRCEGIVYAASSPLPAPWLELPRRARRPRGAAARAAVLRRLSLARYARRRSRPGDGAPGAVAPAALRQLPLDQAWRSFVFPWGTRRCRRSPERKDCKVAKMQETLLSGSLVLAVFADL